MSAPKSKTPLNPKAKVFYPDVPVGTAKRQATFSNCANKNQTERQVYGVHDVKYTAVRLKKNQVNGVVEWARKNWKNELPTYKDMKDLEQNLLCRFLRPSELIKVMNELKRKCFIQEMEIKIQDDKKANELVGKEGRNMHDLTKNNGLLYVWYHKVGHKLVLYAVDKNENCKKAQNNLKKACSDLTLKGYVKSFAFKTIKKTSFES